MPLSEAALRPPDPAPEAARTGPTRAMPRVLLVIAAALLVVRVVLGIVEGPRAADDLRQGIRLQGGATIR